MTRRFRPSLIVIGAVALAVAEGIAGALVVVGVAGHPAATPDQPTFGLTRPVWVAPYYGLYGDTFYTFPVGAVFVPPADAWVIAAAGTPSYSPYMASIDASNVTRVHRGSTCWSEGEYYPGTGTTVYFDCWNSTAETIQLYNASSGNVTRVLPFSSNLDCAQSMTFDPVRQLLYCPGAREAYLRAINVSSGTVVENVSIPPSYRYGTSLWYDTADGAILDANDEQSSVYKMDPASGTILQHALLPGSPRGLLPDSSRGIVLVFWENRTSGGGDGVTILNESNLRLVANVTAPLPIYDGTLDPGSQTAYLSSDHGIVAFDLVEQRFIGQPVAVPCPGDIYGSASGPLALDPVSGQLLVEAACDIGGDTVNPWTALPDVGVDRFPSYSAVPWVGTNLPLVVGVTGGLLGGVTIVVGVVRRSMRGWERELHTLLGFDTNRKTESPEPQNPPNP